MTPWCDSMICRQIERPRPVPFFLKVTKGSKILGSSSDGMPHPVSVIWIRMRSFLSCTISEIWPFGSVASYAFLSRFQNTSCNFVLSPVILKLIKFILDEYSTSESAIYAAKESESCWKNVAASNSSTESVSHFVKSEKSLINWMIFSILYSVNIIPLWMMFLFSICGGITLTILLNILPRIINKAKSKGWIWVDLT